MMEAPATYQLDRDLLAKRNCTEAAVPDRRVRLLLVGNAKRVEGVAATHLGINCAEGKEGAQDRRVVATREGALGSEAEARALYLAQRRVASARGPAAAAWQRRCAELEACLARTAAGHAFLGAAQLRRNFNHSVEAAATLHDEGLRAAPAHAPLQ